VSVGHLKSIGSRKAFHSPTTTTTEKFHLEDLTFTRLLPTFFIILFASYAHSSSFYSLHSFSLFIFASKLVKVTFFYLARRTRRTSDPLVAFLFNTPAGYFTRGREFPFSFFLFKNLFGYFIFM
jgi:hypothetical protein